MSIRSGCIIRTLVILFLVVAVFGGGAYFTYKLFEAPKLMVKKAMGGPTPTPPLDPSLAEFDKCVKVEQGGNLTAARDAFAAFIDQNPDSPRVDEARDELGDINMKLFFSDAPDPDKQQYVIQKGDTITSIERKTKVHGDLIMRLNRIDDPRKLTIGRILNVTRPQFTLKIDRKTQRVVLFNNGKFFKQYKVMSWNAPARKSSAPFTAKVGDESAWENNARVPFGSKEYNLAGRWIAISAAGYTLYSDGVDGVPKPPEGGLGMNAEDVRELSTLINRGTPVTIQTAQ